MPTGYTAYIEDGSITTGVEFLKLCSRAFGVAMELKGKPLSVPTPEYIEPDSFWEDKYSRAVADLDAALSMTVDDARKEMQSLHKERIAQAKIYVAKAEEMNRRYAIVRSQVESWVPPTLKHDGIKDFALNQIDMCIVDKNYLDEVHKTANAVLDDSDEAVAEYIKQNIESCKKYVERAKETWDAELSRVKQRNEFMRQFLNSLENIK